jgi:raffinose/stachyose/melibiose transport system substrate-binding protein
MGISVAACSSGGGSQQANSVVSASGQAPKGVTLTLWHNSADSPALENLYKAYEKASGNTISFVTIPGNTFPSVVQTKWATGARPDILEWHGNEADLLSLDGAKNMVDLSSLPFVKKEGTLAQLSGNINGKTYAATIGQLSVYGIFYNKQVLAKAGLQPPTSYADLASDCATLKAKEPGVTPLFEAGGDQWPPASLEAYLYTAQYNANNTYAKAILSGSAKLSDPSGPFVAGMKSYVSLRNSGCFNSDASTATWAQSLKAVLDGQAAMVANTSDSIPLLDADANGNLTKLVDTVGFVGVSATKPVAAYSPSPLGTFYVPITGNTTKERAAIGFINFITGAGYANYIKQADIIPTLSGTPTPPLPGLVEDVKLALDKGSALALDSPIPGFGMNMGPEGADLLAGQQNPQTVAARMQDYYLQAAASIGS